MQRPCSLYRRLVAPRGDVLSIRKLRVKERSPFMKAQLVQVNVLVVQSILQLRSEVRPSQNFVAAIGIHAGVETSSFAGIEMQQDVGAAAGPQHSHDTVQRGAGVREVVKHRPRINEIKGVVGNDI